MTTEHSRSVSVRSVRFCKVDGSPRVDDDTLVIEEPIELRVDDRSLAVLMRTPGHDEELALGFLLSEGFIDDESAVAGIRPCSHSGPEGNVLRIGLADGARGLFLERTRGAERSIVAGASCGVCGRASIDALTQTCVPFPNVRVPGPALLAVAEAQLRDGQAVFAQTGGLHGAALLDGTGNCLAVREDIGRHNAVDKLIGSFLLTATPIPSDGLLVVSSRVSFEIIQKAWRAGIRMVAGVGAASTLAIDLAGTANIYVAWFLRPGSWNEVAP